MNLLRYIQGFRKGKEANRLEREAMNDPFLNEAMEGYDLVPGNHSEKIADLQRKVASHHSGKKINYLLISGVAAGLLICISLGGYFLFKPGPVDLYSNKVEINKEQAIEEAPAILSESERTREVMEDEKIIKETSQYQSAPVIVQDEEMMSSSVDVQMEISEEKAEPEKFAVQADQVAEDVKEVVKDQKEVQASDITVQAIRQERAAESVSAAYMRIDQKALAKTSSVVLLQPEAGMEEYKKYLKKNMVYPADTTNCGNMKGKAVDLQFKIDNKGRPYDIVVVKSICPAADKEAIRLLKEGGKWISLGKEDEALLSVEF